MVVELLVEHIARQLESVRSTARWLLVGQRVAQWTATLAAVAIALALVDFTLRLPGWLRLLMGVAVAVLAVVWIAGRLRRAWAFRPGLDQLALRLERMYPQLSGRLATAVDFATHDSGAAASPQTAMLVDTALWDVRSRLHGVEVRRLVDPSQTLRLLLVMAAALVVLAALASAMPTHARIAAERWLAPLGSTEWPRRTQVTPVRSAEIWPVDTPLRLTAAVERGYQAGMRVSVEYRVVTPGDPASSWQSLLMTEQPRTAGDDVAARVFERQIEWPESLARRLESSGEAVTVEYRFAGGDDRTAVRTMTLVARPAVTTVVATITPPAYAEGLVAPQTVAMHEASGQIASLSALQGSTVELAVGFNKRVALPEPIGQVLPDASGSLEVSSEERFDFADAVRLRFVLTSSVESPIRVLDEHGLENLSERRYRIEAIEDKPPTVSLVKPATDESVLPTAVVPIEAVAADDVAVRGVRIEAGVEKPQKPGSTQASAGADGADASAEKQTPVELARVESRLVEARAEHGLDLAQAFAGANPLVAGDAVVLHGLAEDVFELGNQRHETVRSTPRRLRIIDETAFITQLRTELSAVRQQAVRVEEAQRQVAAEAEPTTAEQAELTRRIEAQERLVRDLVARAERNRFNEPALREVMAQAGALLNEATTNSREAAAKLQEAEGAPEPASTQAREQAKAEQEGVAEDLAELVSLLDQGGDAMSLELSLRQLQAGQENLAEEARRMFPQTAGQDKASLPQELRDKLDELANQQQAMGEQARDLVRQMQETARRLNEQQNDPKAQAAAQALAEAAAIAQRQGLEQRMQQSGEQIEQNQLSQAAQEQQSSLETLSQMMSQMGTQQERMMAMLRRRLQQLQESIQALVERQKGELAALDARGDDAQLPGLEPAEAALRRSTMAVEEEARGGGGGDEEAMASVVERLGSAVKAQGEAVLALRGAERVPAKNGESAAVSALEEALKRVQEMKQQAAEQEAREKRQELKEEYEKLAARQDELRAAAEPFARAATVDRKDQRAVRDLGHQQGDVQTAAADLRQRVGETLIFSAMHGRLDTAAARAARQLRAATVNADVLAQQAQVATLLRSMAAALGEDPREEPFAGAQQQQEAQQGGGGGGEQPQVVPPAAELKLLRGLQQAVYDQTKTLDGNAAERETLLDLSARQRELSALGEAMIEKLKPPTGEEAQP